MIAYRPTVNNGRPQSSGKARVTDSLTVKRVGYDYSTHEQDRLDFVLGLAIVDVVG